MGTFASLLRAKSKGPAKPSTASPTTPEVHMIFLGAITSTGDLKFPLTLPFLICYIL
jgi:hypothetical protein